MENAASGLAEINQQVEQRKQVLAAYKKEIKKKREINRYYNKCPIIHHPMTLLS